MSTVPAATSVTFEPDREGPLYVGTPLNLVCTITVDRMLVDTDIMVTFDYGSLPSSNGTRIVTTNDRRLNSSAFQGVFEFSYLVPSDDNVSYVCVSTLVPMDSSPFVDPFTNPGSTHRLEVSGK